MRTDRAVLLTIMLLIMTMVLFEFTNLDIIIQDLFYNFESGKWMISRKDPLLKAVFYTGIKKVLIIMGIGAVTAFILSFRKKGIKAHRRKLLLVILSLAIGPSLIAGSKSVTNIYCPSQIERYGGRMPYIKVFERYPENFTPCGCGRCFPAGHASGGFALMSLYFVLKRREYRVAGLVAGLFTGWSMGLYQMLKGAHFLSHTLVTMLSSWLIILLLHSAVGKLPFAREEPARQRAVHRGFS